MPGRRSRLAAAVVGRRQLPLGMYRYVLYTGVLLNGYEEAFPPSRKESQSRPLDMDRAEIEVHVRYQACNDDVCLMPKTETFRFDLELDIVDIPKLGMHLGHGQREGNFNATPHMLRLMWRKLWRDPMALLRFVRTNIRLKREAKRRQNESAVG